MTKAKPPRLKLDSGHEVKLDGGRSVKCFPVISAGGGWLFVFERPGKGKRPVATRLRLSTDAVGAVGLMAAGIMSQSATSELALAVER